MHEDYLVEKKKQWNFHQGEEGWITQLKEIFGDAIFIEIIAG